MNPIALPARQVRAAGVTAPCQTCPPTPLREAAGGRCVCAGNETPRRGRSDSLLCPPAQWKAHSVSRSHLPGIPTLPNHPVGDWHWARGGKLSLAVGPVAPERTVTHPASTEGLDPIGGSVGSGGFCGCGMSSRSSVRRLPRNRRPGFDVVLPQITVNGPRRASELPSANRPHSPQLVGRIPMGSRRVGAAWANRPLSPRSVGLSHELLRQERHGRSNDHTYKVT
jgi:hypothetical protein